MVGSGGRLRWSVTRRGHGTGAAGGVQPSTADKRKDKQLHSQRTCSFSQLDKGASGVFCSAVAFVTCSRRLFVDPRRGVQPAEHPDALPALQPHPHRRRGDQKSPGK